MDLIQPTVVAVKSILPARAIRRKSPVARCYGHFQSMPGRPCDQEYGTWVSDRNEGRTGSWRSSDVRAVEGTEFEPYRDSYRDEDAAGRD